MNLGLLESCFLSTFEYMIKKLSIFCGDMCDKATCLVGRHKGQVKWVRVRLKNMTEGIRAYASLNTL